MGAIGGILTLVFSVFTLYRLFSKMLRGALAPRLSEWTSEAPLGPRGQQMLDGAVHKLHRQLSWAIVIVVAIIGGLALFAAMSSKDGGLLALIFGGVGVISLAIMGAVTWHKFAQIRADKAEGVLLRTAGLIGASSIRNTSYLDLPDRSLNVTSEICDAVRGGVMGIVEYSPRANVVLSIRTADGTSLYEAPVAPVQSLDPPLYDASGDGLPSR